MNRFPFVLLLSSSLAFADATPAPAKEEAVPMRTMVIAAALILSPLFAGWALAKSRSKKPPR